MDMMELRFRMMAMLGGRDVATDVIKGTFTASSSGGYYTLSFGKSFTKYMCLIEMTDQSKTNLLTSGQTSAKMYACVIAYPQPYIDKYIPPDAFESYRIVPTTKALSQASNSTGTFTTSSITLACVANYGGSNNLYDGLSYNYTIVSFD